MKKKTYNHNYFQWNIQRCFSFPFFIAIVLVVLSFFTDADQGQRLVLLNQMESMGGSVLFNLSYILNFGLYYQFSMIFLTLPFAWRFCSEWNSGFTMYLLPTIRLNRYTTHHICFSAISGGLVYMLGTGCYIFLLSLHYPWHDAEWISHYNLHGLGEWIFEGKIFLYFASLLLLFFLWGNICGAVAACISSVISNPYIVMVTPFFLHRCYIEIAKQFQIPDKFRLDYIFLSSRNLPYSPIEIILIASMVTIVICFICWWIFKYNLCRRLEHDKD